MSHSPANKHNTTPSEQPVKSVQLGLFPTMGSIQEVTDFAESKLPITNKNDLFSLLATYRNTLLLTLKK